MNNQHLDFIPSDVNETTFGFVEDITEEEMTKANEELSNRPEPDYSAMVPPDEEGVFGFPFEEEPDNDDAEKIAEKIYLYKDSVVTKEDVAAMIKEHPDWVLRFEDNKFGLTEPLTNAVHQLIAERTGKDPCQKSTRHIPSLDELEDEFGPMDEDDVPSFREIYMGDQEEEPPYLLIPNWDNLRSPFQIPDNDDPDLPF